MRTPSPRALFLTGAVAFAVFLVGVLATRTNEPPTPVSFGVYDVSVVQRPFAATVSFRTTAPSAAAVSWGPAGLRSYLSRRSTTPTLVHAFELPGLTLSARYDATIVARSAAGDTAHSDVPFTTAAAPSEVTGTVVGDVVRVNGGAFFPLIAWQECPGQWEPDLAQGIALFAGNPCTGLPSLLAALGGRALAAGTAEDVADTTGPGLVGWFQPDEADARGLSGESLSRPTGLSFLTLTSHFFSGAAPLPAGRGMYPGLVAKADVVGFDLYPLQELCRPDMLPAVFDAQRELVRLAAGKPTFQWIEVREMKCPSTPVTARTIAVESWLALAGGAHGLGFFPSDRHEPETTAIANVTTRIRQLEPVLLRPPAPLVMTTASPAVRASARTFGDALYVIAVNAGSTSATVKLASKALTNGPVETVGSAKTLRAVDGSLTLTMPPLSVRILVARGS